MFFRKQHWNIVGRFSLISAISYAIIAAGIVALFAHHGLKLGLSFTGGTDVSVRFAQPVAQADITAALADLGVRDAKINTLAKVGEPVGERYTIQTQAALGNETDRLWARLAAIGPVDRAQSQIQSVGPALSREYLIKALEALAIAIVIQFLYIAYRFEWNLIFGFVTVIALVRDSAMMIGIYAIADRPADDAFLAAVLTVVGYSVMDTIVILDRIRENTRIMRDAPYEKIVNTSILQTMTRSLNTLATVVVTLVALLALGGVSLQNFAFALLVGICSGGYHSIFYSAPLVVRLRAMQQRREDKLAARRQLAAGAGAAALARERTEIVTARKERRAREKAQRTNEPVRYRRRREQGEEFAEFAESDDVLEHEEIVLNLEEEEAVEAETAAHAEPGDPRRD